MISELANYHLSPRILKVGVESVIRIYAYDSNKYRYAFDPAVMYTVQIAPMQVTCWDEVTEYDRQDVTPDKDGVLTIHYAFPTEDEYLIRVFHPKQINMSETTPQKRYSPWGIGASAPVFHVYALNEDLYARRPYRGDFHVHSNISDGSEAPWQVAANYRKYGFDFMAMTDHEVYAASVQAQDAFKYAPIDLAIYRGEEIHPYYRGEDKSIHIQGNYVHIVNFGGEYSVQEIIAKDIVKYDKEVKEIMSTEKMPEGVNAFVYASCLWVARQVKKANGFVIFAHPYYVCNTFFVSTSMTEALFLSGEFDGFELLGGHPQYDNNIQTAFYNEFFRRHPELYGKTLALVGSSDSHGSEPKGDALPEWFRWTSTISFTNNLDVQDVIQSVKDRYAVAVESYPHEATRVYGPFRLVLFTHFLLKYYFPVHDELCFEEGCRMKDLITGEDPNAHEILKSLQGRTAKLLSQYWGA